MSIVTTPKRQAQQHLQKALLNTLHEMAPQKIGDTLPPCQEWPSTRQLADANDISIYKARLLLLEMVKNDLATVCTPKANSTLRWYPLTQK
ncbi:hypothetical protein I5M74_22555 [Serratia marcescens]|nr:hypothetical protein [Serratia marcescens]